VSALDKMRARHAEELGRATREAGVLEALPRGYPWKLYSHKTDTWACLAPDHMRWEKEPYTPTLEDVAALALARARALLGA